VIVLLLFYFFLKSKEKELNEGRDGWIDGFAFWFLRIKKKRKEKKRKKYPDYKNKRWYYFQFLLT